MPKDLVVAVDPSHTHTRRNPNSHSIEAAIASVRCSAVCINRTVPPRWSGTTARARETDMMIIGSPARRPQTASMRIAAATLANSRCRFYPRVIQ